MRDITLCHPRIQKIAAAVDHRLRRQKALPLPSAETLRTAAEQDALYAQGPH